MSPDPKRLFFRQIDFGIFAKLVLLCWGIIIYSNTFRSSFQFDDNLFIIDNLSLRNPTDLLAIWNCWPSRFIAFFSFSLNYAFHGLDVFGYHLFNLAIHLSAGMLVWWLVMLTFSTPVMKIDALYSKRSLIAFFAGLLFLSHPAQTEAVTYIYQRSASLVAFFYLLCLCLYVKSRLQGKNILYVLSWLACLAAMFTKENSVTLPLALVLYEACFLRQGWYTGLKFTLPFLIILPLVPLTVFLFRPITVVTIDQVMARPVTALSYFFTQLRVMVTYIRLLLIPFNQNIDYDYPIYKSLLAAPVLAGLSVLSLIVIAAVRLLRRHRIVTFSICWCFLTLLLESSFLPITDVIFEHRLYLPMAGYSIIIVYSVFYFFRSRAAGLAAAVLLAVITCYSIVTYNRNFVWRDQVTLWADAVNKAPEKARPHNHLGFAYTNFGDYDAAISECSRAIGLNRNYASAYYNRGNAYFFKSINNKTGFNCRRKDELAPDFVELYSLRVPFCFNADDLGHALSDYSQALKINPKYTKAYINRGVAYFIAGNFPQAISDYNLALSLNPRLSDIYTNRALTYAAMGNFPQAISDYTQAIKIYPRGAAAYYDRAIAYYLAAEFVNAEEDLSTAEKLGFKAEAGFLERLGRAKANFH